MTSNNLRGEATSQYWSIPAFMIGVAVALMGVLGIQSESRFPPQYFSDYLPHLMKVYLTLGLFGIGVALMIFVLHRRDVRRKDQSNVTLGEIVTFALGFSICWTGLSTIPAEVMFPLRYVADVLPGLFLTMALFGLGSAFMSLSFRNRSERLRKKT